MIRSRSGHVESPQQLLKELNSFLYEDLTRAELFISLFYLSYRPDVQMLTYASAGHTPALLWQESTGQCKRLDPEGLIIGVKEEFPYVEESCQLEVGDLLILYTDGLVEAENFKQELFGEERLCELIVANRDVPPDQFIKNVIEQVQFFTGHQFFNDDVSMIVMKVTK